MEYVLPHSIYPLNGQSISGNGRLVVGVAHVPDTPPNHDDHVRLWDIETDEMTTVNRT